jgi:G3E family GTPase
VAIARQGEVDPDFLLGELSAPRHRFDLGGADHGHGIESFSLIFERPFFWPAFTQAMAVLAGLRGPDLLRVKGLVAVEGCPGPVVVHFVQHVAHPPVELEEWPDADRRTRLVFVTRGLGRVPVEQLFTGINAVGAVTSN